MKESFKLGNGTSVRFWKDVWLDNSSLANQYPAPYNIAQRKNSWLQRYKI
jgi:hypothetical protein